MYKLFCLSRNESKKKTNHTLYEKPSKKIIYTVVSIKKNLEEYATPPFFDTLPFKINNN